MTAPVRALRPDQPFDAPDAPGVAFSAWNYGHDLARSKTAAKVGTAAYVVLHAIASHANKQAQAEVGHARIVEECGLSRSTVMTALDRLCACRAIGRLQRHDDATGINEVNLYTILPLEGIVAHPIPERRRAQARQRGRVRCDDDDASAGSADTAPSSETAPSSGDYTTLVAVTTPPPSSGDDTTLVAVTTPKASPLSIPSISIPSKHPRSASGDAPPATAPKNGAQSATRSGTGTKTRRRERACASPEEEGRREELMQAFNDYLRPVDFTELGRCRNEMLRGLREHEFADMVGCLRALATSKRFVGQSWVTPVTIVRNVLLWQDAGRPRQWCRVEEYAATKARQQGGR